MARRYHNHEGVDIRPYDWGGLGGVSSLDPSVPRLSEIYAVVIEALTVAGYQERVDLFGAPYDFRLAPDGLEQVCSQSCSCPTMFCSGT